MNDTSDRRESPGIRTRLTQIPALDGLRGIGILVVLAVHLVSGLNIPDIARQAVVSGFVIIELFFVLSGFLITRVLLDAKGRPAYFSTFYMRRILRIWPLYFAVLLFVFAVGSWTSGPLAFNTDKYHWSYYAAFRQNLVFPDELGPGMLAVTWSLAIEEQFYLVWPFAVACLSRARLGQLAVAVMISQPVIRYLLLSRGASGLEIYIATYCRWDGLACGALLALYETSRGADLRNTVATRWLRNPWVRGFAGVGLLTASLVTLVQLRGTSTLNVTPASGVMLVALSMVYSLAALGFGLCLMRVLDGQGTRWLTLPALQYCGKVSYSLYLIHMIVIILHIVFVYPAIDRVIGRGLPAMAIKGACVLTTIFLVSHLTWRFIECPFMALKSRLRANRLPAERGTVESHNLGEASA